MTTPTVEAYLEIIYMMAVEGQPVIGARLAESLHVSRPTVTTTLKRMTREGLVKIDAHKAIQMTGKGQAIAERLQHRHRIVERWLTDVLGFDWAKSDAEAHRLEHAMSDEVAELLNKHLGYPTTCPHGNPIPGNTRGVASTSRQVFQLSAAKEGDRVVVVRVSEYAENVAELLDHLGQRGVTPGAQVSVIEVAPLKGPLTLKIGARTTSMSREVADFVWVKTE
ncbi:MAG: metal-dependent transcriptional regulator [Chloroflexota bacterium]|nr:metal-dependent transcriptional regulator [Chloroflexota bacterium]